MSMTGWRRPKDGKPPGERFKTEIRYECAGVTCKKVALPTSYLCAGCLEAHKACLRFDTIYGPIGPEDEAMFEKVKG